MAGLQGLPLMAILGVSDLDTSVDFYSAVLGLPVVSRDSYGASLEAGEAELRLTLVDAVAPHPYSQLGWRVPEIELAAGSLARAGVELTRYPGLDQDNAGVWTAHDGTRVAWFPDPDGNVLSIVQGPPVDASQRATLPGRT